MTSVLQKCCWCCVVRGLGCDLPWPDCSKHAAFPCKAQISFSSATWKGKCRDQG